MFALIYKKGVKHSMTVLITWFQNGIGSCVEHTCSNEIPFIETDIFPP